MSDLDMIIIWICVTLGLLAFLLALVLADELWRGFKDFFRGMTDVFVLMFPLKPHCPPSRPREPDWADAADEVGFFDPIPEPLWSDLDELWSYAERQAYDLDATSAFIDSTDQTLSELEEARVAEERAAEWAKFGERADRSEAAAAAHIARQDELARKGREAQRQRELASERALRRAGVQLIATAEDDVLALIEWNRAHPTREQVIETRLG